MVVGRSDEVGDLGYGPGQLVLGDAGEDGLADASVSASRVENHEARLVERERGGIQVLGRTKATLLAGAFDAGEHRRDQLVKQVEDVVQGRDLLDLGEGEEGRLAAGR